MDGWFHYFRAYSKEPCQGKSVWKKKTIQIIAKKQTKTKQTKKNKKELGSNIYFKSTLPMASKPPAQISLGPNSESLHQFPIGLL